MQSEQLFPHSWELQKVLLNDFYGYGKAEISVVFASMFRDYIMEQIKDNPESEESYKQLQTTVMRILSDAKQHCKLTLE